MPNNKKIGIIKVQNGALVQPHEIATARVLIMSGDDVIFLRPSNASHSADIKYGGMVWEIKSPKGASRRTIENNIRLAMKQSKKP